VRNDGEGVHPSALLVLYVTTLVARLLPTSIHDIRL
jgi:hypothetical protein